MCVSGNAGDNFPHWFCSMFDHWTEILRCLLSALPMLERRRFECPQCLENVHPGGWRLLHCWRHRHSTVGRPSHSFLDQGLAWPVEYVICVVVVCWEAERPSVCKCENKFLHLIRSCSWCQYLVENHLIKPQNVYKYLMIYAIIVIYRANPSGYSVLHNTAIKSN